MLGDLERQYAIRDDDDDDDDDDDECARQLFSLRQVVVLVSSLRVGCGLDDPEDDEPEGRKEWSWKQREQQQWQREHWERRSRGSEPPDAAGEARNGSVAVTCEAGRRGAVAPGVGQGRTVHQRPKPARWSLRQGR